MHRFIHALAACLLLCASPVWAATINVASTDAAYAAVKVAQPGDVVQIAAGSYGALSLYSLKPAGVVTVQPVPGAKVTVTGISADAAANLTIRGFDVGMALAQQYGATAQSGASNITFDGLSVHQADNTTLAGSGFFVRDSDSITIKNADIHHVGAGVGILQSTNVLVSGNRLHDVATDGILVACNQQVQVVGNSFINFHPGVGDHPDAIQGFCTVAGAIQSDITIKDNDIRRGPTGQVIQGIFLEATKNATITGNALSGTMFNAISLSTSGPADVGFNFAQGWTDDCAGQPCSTRMITRGQSVNVTVHDNAFQGIGQVLDGGLPNPGYVELRNTVIPAAPPGDYSAMNAWIAAKGGSVPPPVVTPPAVDPRDATIATLTAQVASLTAAANDNAAKLLAAQTAAATAQSAAQAASTQLAATQAQLAALQASTASVSNLQKQLATAQAQVTTLQGKIAKAQADLK
jgi:hypothetical protein